MALLPTALLNKILRLTQWVLFLIQSEEWSTTQYIPILSLTDLHQKVVQLGLWKHWSGYGQNTAIFGGRGLISWARYTKSWNLTKNTQASCWTAVHFKSFLSINLKEDILINKERENGKLAKNKRRKLNVLKLWLISLLFYCFNVFPILLKSANKTGTWLSLKGPQYSSYTH